MRRSKIKPSINLSASRRSLSQSGTSRADRAKKQPVKESAISPAKPLPTVDPPAAADPLSVDTPRQESAKSPRPEALSHEPTHLAKDAEDVTTVTENVLEVQVVDDTDKETAGDEAIVKPSSLESKLNSNVQRRRRISATPNLGQHRMRLPMPTVPRQAKKRVDTVKTNTDNAVDVDDPDINVAKPLIPPPVQRVVESFKPIPEIPHSTIALANSTETSSTSSQHNPIRKIVHPKPSHLPSRTECVVDKRASFPTSMQDKRIRDLKALEAETPAKRRKRYVNKVIPPDRSTMTMSDLIYYNPKANPMKSSLEFREKINNNNNNVKVKSSVSKEVEPTVDEEETDTTDDLAPRVRIDADGNIVIDKSSLTIEASPIRTFVTEDSEILHEDSSHVTYASFRKRIHTTAWTKKETERFFLALSMVGTDFSMVNTLFPKRTRQQIKNKFKREERVDRVRIDVAIRDKRPLDKSMFEQNDSDVENREDRKKKRAKKKGPRTKVVSSVDAILEEEDEFNECLLEKDDDSDDEVEVINILARPTRSGRVPKIRIHYNSFDLDDAADDYDDEPNKVDKEAVVVRTPPCVQRTPPCVQRTPSGVQRTVLGTPTTPMQTVYVVTPLQGGKQFMIRQHSIPQPSPEAIQAALVDPTTVGPQSSSFRTMQQQPPILQLQTSSQQVCPAPHISPANLQLRVTSPQNPVTSPTGSHTVMTQRVGNTQIIVVSPARGPGNIGPDLLQSMLPTNVQSTGMIQLQRLTNLSPVVAHNVGQSVTNDVQQRTFIRIQPGDVHSPNASVISTAIPISGLAQHSPSSRRTSLKSSQPKCSRLQEVRLDEPFIPPSMKTKVQPKEGANSINAQQKVIVQNLHQGYPDVHVSKHPGQVLLLDDVTLAAQTEVVSDVAMEVEAECVN